MATKVTQWIIHWPKISAVTRRSKDLEEVEQQIVVGSLCHVQWVNTSSLYIAYIGAFGLSRGRGEKVAFG